MSSIKLKHSGGNSVSLNPPTSAPTSSEVAFKLPNADGSAGQLLKTDGSGNFGWATDQGGKILKVQYDTYAVSTAMGGASTYNMYGGLVVTFTPTVANSKLLVMMTQAGQHQITSDGDISMTYKLKRTIAGGTETDVMEHQYVADRGPSNGRHFHFVPLFILDTPSYSVGDSIVYKPKIHKHTANYGTTYQAQYGPTVSHCITMEIAA
jgi:hypothetical protein